MYKLKQSKKIKNFLKKINCNYKNMDIDQKIIEWNKKMFPNPTFIGFNQLIQKYSFLNWRNIEKFRKSGTIRHLPVKMLMTANVIFDPNNPNHAGKPTKDSFYYALEDAELLKEKEEIIKSNNNQIILGKLPQKYKDKVILRDFTKLNPDKNEINFLSDSLATFIGFLALEKLKEKGRESFDQNVFDQFEQLLDEIYTREK